MILYPVIMSGSTSRTNSAHFCNQGRSHCYPSGEKSFIDIGERSHCEPSGDKSLLAIRGEVIVRHQGRSLC